MDPILIILITVVAVLYSSVGHAGASGYIAVMTFLAIAPESIRPTALAMNLAVATIATVQFSRAGHFRWSLFWPFALAAPPCAYLATQIPLSLPALKLILGGVLLFSAVRFILPTPKVEHPTPPRIPVAILTGAALGFLAGLTSTGGGIFLTPLLLLAAWASPKEAAAVSAPFILVNSLAGLLGFADRPDLFLPGLPILIIVAALGGLLGSSLSAFRLPSIQIRQILSVTLFLAAFKFLWPAHPTN